MSAPSAPRAVIVGAGVGGLATAVALQRAGIEAVVLERHTDPRAIESGGAFILWNNAMRALAELGLADDVASAGCVLDSAEWRTPIGRRLARWPVAEIGDAVGAPAIGVRRTHLQAALVQAVAPGTLRLGVSCAGLLQQDDGVAVQLDDGSTEHADVVVGADGIRSIVRAELDGQARPPRDAGYWQYFGIAPLTTELTAEGIFLEVDGPGQRFFAFPIGGGETYWAAAVCGPLPAPSVDGARDDALQRFGRWARPVEALLAATPDDAIHRRAITDRAPTRRWGRGAVTLVGDAAHPITPNLGQGACQAIEDGVVLARTIAVGRGSIESLLRDYEEQRFDRTASFVRRARVIASMGRWRNPLSCLLRDQIARVAIPGPALRRHRRDMAYQF